MTCAATSRSRAVSSALTGRRELRSSKLQMPASCGASRFSARPVTLHQKISPRKRPSRPLHEPVVGVGAVAIEQRDDARAGALVFVGARVQDLEGLPDKLLAGSHRTSRRRGGLQLTMVRLRESTRPTGARSKASW